MIDPYTGLSRRDDSLLYGADGRILFVWEPWFLAGIEAWWLRGSEPVSSPLWAADMRIQPTSSRLLAQWIAQGYDQIDLGDGAGWRTIVSALDVIDDVQRTRCVLMHRSDARDSR